MDNYSFLEGGQNVTVSYITRGCRKSQEGWQRYSGDVYLEVFIALRAFSIYSPLFNDNYA